MNQLQWTEDYSVNIQEIDSQHQELLDLANEVCAAINSSEEEDILGDILANLIEFTKIHFATEERMMKIFRFPDRDGHESEHRRLKERLLEFEQQFSTGQALLPVTVEHFLLNEIINHFKTMDMEFGAFLNSRGVS